MAQNLETGLSIRGLTADTNTLQIRNSSNNTTFIVDNTGNVGIGTSTPTEKLDVNGKTKTTNLQVTNGATAGYVLTATDSLGNMSWQQPTSFTGGTVAGASNFTAGLTASSINTTSITLNNNRITAFTDTFVTGFTYNDNNRLTISQNQGQSDLNVFINTMSGLTVNGNLITLTATTTDLVVNGNVASDLLPKVNRSGNLGSGTRHWLNVYTQKIRLGDNSGDDQILITTPQSLTTSPDPAWQLMLPVSNGPVFSMLGTWSTGTTADASIVSQTAWFTLSAGTNISLNQLAFSSGSVITINSTSSGGGTFTGGTVSGPTNFTNGLTANTFTIGGVTYNSLTNLNDTTNLGTGITIHFSARTIFNLPDSPASGNISGDTANAKFGMVQKIYHQSSIEPTFQSNWKLIGEGVYFTNQLNIIYAEYITNSRIEYWIIQEY